MIGRPINPNSARQQRIRAAQGRQKLHARPKLATDNGKLVIPSGLIDAIQANARERRRTRADNPEINPFLFKPTQLHPPGSMPPKDVQMAMDQAIGWASGEWGSGGPLGQVFAEGLAFPGYPYLSELAQRPEYRTAGEIISTEMTRKWIQFSGKGTAHQQRQRDRKMAEDFGLPDPHAEQREDDEAPESSEKQEKIAQLEEFLDNLNCRGAYRLLEATDCYFGRAHLFHEINGNDGSSSEGSEELQSDLGLGIGDTSRSKVNRENPLTRLTNVEPVWIYPTTYNAMNPLVKDFYNPSVWYMQGIPVHCSRMFTQIGRPVPDLLKPAYSFGGLSLSQIMQPYVNIWLETRESIGRLIHAFSVMVLSTDLQTLMQPGGGALMERINLFNTLRDNNGCFVINKNTEDFKNISVPLGGLHELQAQSQEHLCVQAGTLIETQRGAVPIEDMNLADMVLTRSGLAPLKWIGITGHVDSFIEITTDDAIIRITQCHPIWSETIKQFVPAQSVRPSHRLLGLKTSSLGNMAHPSRGVAAGGGKRRRVITATRKAAASSIASFGKRTADLCRRSMTSITEILMASTTLSIIWNLLRGPNTTPAMLASASMSSTVNTSRSAPNAAMTSLRSSPTKPSIVHTHAMPSLTDFDMDGSRGRNIMSSNVASAGAGSSLRWIPRVSVPTDVASVLVKQVEVRGVERQLVYNLEVDGPPEFFANGILVHNCSVIRAPVAVYTGISPTGLNASSEGEIRIFENNIHAAQESRYRQNLTKTINFAQLSLWDEIDPDITFEFVQLRELTEKEEAELRKLDAETDDILMNGCQAISPEEVRIRVAGDENGPHAGIDPDDLPEPPQPPTPPGEGGEQGESRPGEGGAPGEPKPGGRINVSGREEYTGVGDSAEFKEGDHPRAPDGKFGSGGGGSKEVHVTARTNENGKPVILGAHPTAHAAEAHRDQIHKSDWDKQQREDRDDPEDRDEFPGHEGFMKGQNNAHGELVNPENIVRWHVGSGGVGEGGETHVVATGEHSEAAGGPTMNIKVHGSYATKREAEAAASVVAAQAWAQHGDTLGHHEDEWAEATTDTINDWNSAHPNDEPIDPEMVAIAGNRTGPDAWYVNVVGPDDELSEKKLPPELAKQIDALEEQPAPYPGLKKALAYWRDAGDYEHIAPVIKQLKMAP